MDWLLIILGSFVILLNWGGLLRFYISNRRHGFSSIPLIGGVLAAAGLYISGNSVLNNFFWLPLIIDIGCMPTIVLLIIKTFKLEK